MNIKDNFIKSFENGFTELCNYYDDKINILEKQAENQTKTIEHLHQQLSLLEGQHDILKVDFDDYKSVSIVKNLNKQILEKDTEINRLNGTINRLNTKKIKVINNNVFAILL